MYSGPTGLVTLLRTIRTISCIASLPSVHPITSLRGSSRLGAGDEKPGIVKSCNRMKFSPQSNNCCCDKVSL